MRYITVPQTIEVTPPAGTDAPPEALPFQKFAGISWLNDDRAIEAGFAAQVRWADVVRKFASAREADVIELEDADYATLAAIAQAPRARLMPAIAIQLLPYTRAVLDAPTRDPRGATVVPYTGAAAS
jgi:hypothetical protein